MSKNFGRNHNEKGKLETDAARFRLGASPSFDSEPPIISSVGLIMIGFVLLIGSTIVARVVGFGMIIAFFLGWLSSIVGILTVAFLLVWNEARLKSKYVPVVDPLSQWQDDLDADRRRAEQIRAWDSDRLVDQDSKKRLN